MFRTVCQEMQPPSPGPPPPLPPPHHKIGPKPPKPAKEINGEIPDARDSVDQRLLICHICQETYRRPKILTCLHSFCKPCIEDYAAQQAQEGAVPCPICNFQSVIPKEGISGFKTNTFINSLNGGDDLANGPRRCDFCVKRGKTTSAILKCLECREFLCGACSENHKLTSITMHHHTLSLADLRSGRYSREIRAIEQVTCDIHKNEVITLYCLKCRQPICRDCKVNAHDGHDCAPLKDATERYLSKVGTLMDKLKSHIEQETRTLEDYNDYSSGLKLNHTEMVRAIQERDDELCQLVHKLRDKTIERESKLYQDEKKRITEERDRMHSSINAMNTAYSFTENILKHGQDVDIMSLGKNILDRISSLCIPQAIPDRKKFSFQPGKSPTSMDQLFGVIQEDTIIGKKPDKTVELVLMFELKTENDKHEPNPEGLAVTPDGEIIVTDSDNRKLKIFDMEGQLITSFRYAKETNLRPYSICILDNRNIVVSCKGELNKQNCKVLIYSPDGQNCDMFDIENSCSSPSLCRYHSNQFVVADTKNAKATIYTAEGEPVRTISVTDRKNIAPLDDFAHYIHLHQDSNLLVSHFPLNCVQSYNSKGEVVWSYGRQGKGQGQFDDPYGICTDLFDNVIISDFGNNRVHMISPDGKFQRVLLTEEDGLQGPMAVKITDDGHLVLSENTGRVKVYKYQH